MYHSLRSPLKYAVRGLASSVRKIWQDKSYKGGIISRSLKDRHLIFLEAER